MCYTLMFFVELSEFMPNSEERLNRTERGIKYPADNLESAIDLLSRVKNSLGYGGASREILAEALGYRGISGTSARKIGSLTHYDLVERVGNGAYRISDLGRRILVPTSDSEKQEAIAEAAKRPALFSALFQKYEDRSLPTLLPNILTREHGVASSAAEQAANTFRETAEYAGLLRRGVLYAHGTSENLSDLNAVVDEELTPAASTPVQSSGRSERVRETSVSDYTVPLDGAGRVAVLSIPLPATLRDMRRINAWTDYMTRVLEEESAEFGSE